MNMDNQGDDLSSFSVSNPGRNLLLRIAYDGTDFFGWQIQPERPTVQGIIAEAIKHVSGESVYVCGAGRTDAGVHAAAQAANVRIIAPIPCSNFVIAMNEHIPVSIRLLSAQEVDLRFHALRDAQSKIYCYRLYRGAICPPWLARFTYHHPHPLDESAMAEAARFYEGTWDFKSFASKDRDPQSQNKSTIRTIFSARIERDGEELRFTVQGSGFLHHMVRNLMGTLILIGRRFIAPDQIKDIIEARSRTEAGPTIPARGLHLLSVVYPDQLFP